MITNIHTVIEAAETRAAQWRSIANGLEPHDVVDELYEVWGENEGEAASIADEQEAAITELLEALPPCAGSTSVDSLATNAMAIWEFLLDGNRYRGRAPLFLDDDLYEWVADGEGACSARDGCWDLAGLAEEGYQYLQSLPSDVACRYEAFDWDFIPCWIPAMHAVAMGREVMPQPREMTRQDAQDAVAIMLMAS